MRSTAILPVLTTLVLLTACGDGNPLAPRSSSPAVQLGGRVLSSPAGHPVSGAAVRLISRGGLGPPRTLGSAMTGADGTVMRDPPLEEVDWWLGVDLVEDGLCGSLDRTSGNPVLYSAPEAAPAQGCSDGEEDGVVLWAYARGAEARAVIRIVAP